VRNGLRTEITAGAQRGAADARLTKSRIMSRTGAKHSWTGALVFPLDREGRAIL
jgi:hypothetical protein